MKNPRALDDEAMRRIAMRVRMLMIEKNGLKIIDWMTKHGKNVESLAQCTWLATLEELDNERKN